jgi:uncharacterized HAD superfamily protein
MRADILFLEIKFVFFLNIISCLQLNGTIYDKGLHENLDLVKRVPQKLKVWKPTGLDAHKIRYMITEGYWQYRVIICKLSLWKTTLIKQKHTMNIKSKIIKKHEHSYIFQR